MLIVKRKVMKSKLLLFGLAGLLFTSCDQDDGFGPGKERIIEAANLPVEIQNYVSTHFSEYSIVKAIEEKEPNGLEYEVNLRGGYQLDFNTYLHVTEIKGNAKLPDSVIPESILNYTNVNYPDLYIIKWEWEDTYQQVELSNTLELEFTTTGEYIRVDND